MNGPQQHLSDQQDIDIPVVLVDGLNHGSIIESPTGDLVQHVADALEVDSAKDYQDWQAEARTWSAPARKKVDEWQQFVIRAVDERGDGIPDYNVQIGWKGESSDFEGESLRRGSLLQGRHQLSLLSVNLAIV